MDKGLEIAGSQSHIIPIILGGSQRALAAASRLADGGLYIPAIRYPSVSEGQARLRVSLSSQHSPQQIANLLQKLGES